MLYRAVLCCALLRTAALCLLFAAKASGLPAGDADAEVKRLMTESAEMTSAQKEAEAHLQQSQRTIDDLQAVLRTAQVTSNL